MPHRRAIDDALAAIAAIREDEQMPLLTAVKYMEQILEKATEARTALMRAYDTGVRGAYTHPRTGP